MISGILNVYKEEGFTSHDVVAKLRHILGQRRIGHTGTLDPAAVGVLPVCLGSATKVCDLLTDTDKEYRADMLLGVSTDTQDTTGTVVRTMPVNCSESRIMEAAASFEGIYEQVPPMYSALKVNGKKLCDLAREGKEVERRARTVRIYRIVIEKMALPHVTIRVSCSKGTYIRTLCQDIGDRLGCGGCVARLERLRAGRFISEDSHTISQISEAFSEDRLGEWIISADSLFEEYPRAVCAASEKLLLNGNPLRPGQIRLLSGTPEYEDPQERPGKIRLYDESGRFTAIYRWSGEKQLYIPEKMFI
ncbi:MAG: tRNA pseudouridine(55) synthase TruB [Lachnospiraceae bacterium]|nr:tRNA pseudouridine(55) synthase TruB [Lachnospiraceae bacterium]